MAAIHWKSGVSGDWATAANWSSGTVPGAGDDVTIAATGTYMVTISDNEAAHSLTLNDAGATVVLGTGGNNTFTVGSTLTLAAGTFQLNQGATIVGGTLSATGGAFDWAGGELSGVTYDGALNLTSGRAFLFVDGLTLKGANGTGPGTINLSGQYDANLLAFGETLDNATVNMSDAARYSTTAITLFDAGDTNPGLTLGKNLDIVQTTGQASIGQYFNFSDNSLVNDGSISTSGGSFTIGVNNVVNNGVITVGAGETFSINANTLTEGAGSKITVASGSTLDLGVNLTTAQLLKITNSGVIAIGRYGGATLTNTGATLTVGPGTADPAVELNGGGVLVGGTIVDKGSGVVFNGGTLSGVTFDGTMDLSERNSYAVITGGLTEAGVNGKGAGAIDLNGGEGDLRVDCGETLDNATLTIGYQSRVFLFDPSGVNPDITLGSGFDVVDGANACSIVTGSYSAALPTIVNDGAITADLAHGGFIISVGALVNNGTISVSNGDTLNLQLGTLTQGAKGTILVASGGTLDIGAALTTAALDQITNSGGTVGIGGTLTNTGATLRVGTGTAEPAVALQSGGVILGGTIADEGSGIHFNGGTLSGVAFKGVMNLAPIYSTVVIENGLAATGANGQGPGQIDLGFLAFFDAAGGETLDNATLDMGNGSNFDLDDLGDTAPVLTLGAHFSIVQNSNGGIISVSNGDADDTLVNDGSITAGFAGSNGLLINGVNFTNNGALIATAGGALFLQPQILTNLAGTTLTGGFFEADGGSVIELNQNVSIVTLEATLDLNGAGSSLQSFNTTSDAEVAIDSTLGTIGAAGTLEILGGRNWTSPKALASAGTLDLGGGIFTAPSLSNSGTVSGFGTIASALTNTGALTIQGGQTLSLEGGSLTNLSAGILTGGTFTIGAGATLQLADNVSISSLRATIDLVGAGATIQSLDTTTSKEVSLGSSLKTIGPTGVLEILGGATFTTTNTIANAGTVDMGGTFTGGGLTNTGSIGGFGDIAAALTNSGAVSVQANKTLSLQGGSLTNLSGTTLTGGKFTIGVGATFQLADNTSIATLDATIDLAGAGAQVQGLNTGTSKQVTLQSSLTAIGAAGDLQILGGAGFSAAKAIANSGTIQLGGGTLAGGVLSDAAGSRLTGFGTIASTISDAGATTASGGALVFTGKGDVFSAALAGTEIDFAGGTDLLSTGASLTAATVRVSGGAVVNLAANQAIAGKLTEGAGTLNLGANTLTLSGAGTSLDGTVSGPGTLAVAGGTVAIDANASLAVSHWSLTGGVTTIARTMTYKGAFAEGAAATLTLTAGDKLTLTGGASLSGLVHGASRLTVSGAAVSGLTLGGTTILEAAGNVSQTGAFTLGDKSSKAATLTIDAGATWTMAGGGGIARGTSGKSVINVNGVLTNAEDGTSVVAARVVDAGAVVAATGTLELVRNVGGTGALAADAGATLQANGVVAATLSMTFAGAGATLALKDPSAFAATIAGFAAGETIDLLAKKATKATLGANDTLVIDNGGRHVATLQLTGDYTGDTFAVATDGNGGTAITVTGEGGAAPPEGAGAFVPNLQPFVAAAAGLGGARAAAHVAAVAPGEPARFLLAAPHIQAA